MKLCVDTVIKSPNSPLSRRAHGKVFRPRHPPRGPGYLKPPAFRSLSMTSITSNGSSNVMVEYSICPPRIARLAAPASQWSPDAGCVLEVLHRWYGTPLVSGPKGRCEGYLAQRYKVSISTQYLYTNQERSAHLLALDSDRK